MAYSGSLQVKKRKKVLKFFADYLITGIDREFFTARFQKKYLILGYLMIGVDCIKTFQMVNLKFSCTILRTVIKFTTVFIQKPSIKNIVQIGW